MKSFLQHIKESQQAAYARYYALSQKKRHDVDKAKLDRQAEYLQDATRIGLQSDDAKTKLDQILFGLFYLGNALRLIGDVSASNINATVSQELPPSEINQNLEKPRAPMSEPALAGKSGKK